MKILVTGGIGYIGSHTVVSLIEQNHQVVIVDDLSNSKIETLKYIEQITGKSIEFHQINICEKDKTEAVFKNHTFDGLIHFAGYKAVGESVKKPLKYYQNNLISTMSLVELCLKYNVNKFVFSSSATVYGDNKAPYKEDMALLPTTNPYGETKAMIERILSDVAKVNPDFKVSLLRYFNPVGAHQSGFLGEDPQGIPNNLMPYLLKVATGEYKELQVFGNDYDTVDGTGVRDYIHVVDLAEGHVSAIEKLTDNIEVYNLGTGMGTSVLQIIGAFEKVNTIKIPYKIVARRSGDIATSFADTAKAKKELGWAAKKNIDDMVKDSWYFAKKSKK